jgi:fatty-acyl-CoA synthase
MAVIEAERNRPKSAGAETALRDWVRALEATAPIAQNPQRLLYDIIADVAQRRADAPALLSKDKHVSYRTLIERANRYARWALDQNLAKGDVVALMLPNCPDYMAIWLGLSSVGITVALLNTQLRGPSLNHCIAIAAPRHIITAADYSAAIQEIAPQLPTGPKVWWHGGGPKPERIDQAIARFSGTPLMQRPTVTTTDRALLIYTSGTTGLPKAANVSHRRLLQWSLWFAGLINIGPDDRMYDCLPMYHSIGGVVATGALLARGGSVLIAEKFSAQHFWDDVVDGGCTLFQYIGELARYLLNAPPTMKERAHRLRLACGNGLRADVWQKFQERFAIPRILEFYAATEGNVSLYNVEGRVGAVGRIPPFLASRFPLTLVHHDTGAGAPARDANGFCVRCTTGEIGEAIGRIPANASQAGGEFEGYGDRADTERKILRNVFEPGDAWFRTGDLMRMDAGGFYYFVDRIGDTFRWKGENVSTTEVAAALGAFAGIGEAVVYGVPVPGTEGKAGMAAIVANADLDLSGLYEHLARHLPPYARPLFLRLAKSLDATSTFKHAKHDLQRDSFDPAVTDDPIFFANPAAKTYVRLDGQLYARIQAGKIKL